MGLSASEIISPTDHMSWKFKPPAKDGPFGSIKLIVLSPPTSLSTRRLFWLIMGSSGLIMGGFNGIANYTSQKGAQVLSVRV
jgi:hypothetical protein